MGEFVNIIDNPMLFQARSHFYVREGGLRADMTAAFDIAFRTIIEWLNLEALIITPPPPLPLPALPSSDDWAGLLIAEAISRPDQIKTLIDLTSPMGRSRLSDSLESLDFMGVHDNIILSQSLDDYIDSASLPNPTQVPQSDMERICKANNISFQTIHDGLVEQVTPPNSLAPSVFLDKDTGRYSAVGILTSERPARLIIGHDNDLRSVFWNANGYDGDKMRRIGDTADAHSLDLICLTDTRVSGPNW